MKDPSWKIFGPDYEDYVNCSNCNKEVPYREIKHRKGVCDECYFSFPRRINRDGSVTVLFPNGKVYQVSPPAWGNQRQ